MKEVMIIERIFPKYRKDILDLLYQKMEFLFLAFQRQEWSETSNG